MESNELTPAQAAQYLGYSRSHVYNMMNAGDLPYSKRRGRCILNRSELEMWKASNTVSHPTNGQLESRAQAFAATHPRR